MEKNYFLITERIKQIETTFIKEGWLTIYESAKDDLIYCCLVDSSKIEDYKNQTDWVIRPYSEGKPAVYGDGTYKTYSEDGFEPFIFIKHFHFNGGDEQYIDISEEFILYFKLFERGENKQNRKFFFIDDLGELDEVINIEPKRIKIKLKYLKEYIAIRQLHFSICFDFMRVANIDVQENQIAFIDEDFKGENYFYNHLIRALDGKFQSWIIGKKIISFDPAKTKSYHFDYENQVYEKFITAYDNDGNEVYQDCSKSNEKSFVLTYFKKDVLNKYYNEPNKYDVDGWHVKSKYFTLKIDNNLEDYVAVFLIELGYLPHREQLHWKHHNIQPQNGISNAYYKTMIEGSWVEHPETPDLFFKHKYEQFNKKWEEKFGWRLYKPLANEDKFRFNSLHVPTSNNVKSFCEQILSLSIITIDRLNEEELEKKIEKPKKQAKDFKKELLEREISVPDNILIQDKGLRGISKFELYLEKHNFSIPNMFEFLRMLYDLRSGLLAHSFSNSNDKCKNAIKYFNIKDDNYVEVAKKIFIKSVYTFNTLEGKLLTKETIE